jgi:hypothetical protein
MENGRAWALPEMLIWARAIPGCCSRIRQCGHAAHRVADQAGQLVDAECAHHLDRGIGHVLDRQLGKAQAVQLAGGRVDRGRAGGALAAAQRVDADHEPAVGIDRLARAQHCFPPAGGGVAGVGRGVRIRRQPGDDKDGVAGLGIQRAPGLIGHMRADQLAAAFHREGRRQGVVTGARRDEFGHREILASCGDQAVRADGTQRSAGLSERRWTAIRVPRPAA